MDSNSITIMFFVLVGIGIVLVVFSLVLDRKNSKNNDTMNSNQLNMINEEQDKLSKSIDDADDAIEQLNSISKHIFKEQEDKYQELLYLYQVIDEKKLELSELYEKTISIEVPKSVTKKITETSDDIVLDNMDMDKEEKNINNKYNEILDLYKEGMTITQIAKKLDIGQGEVSLILELKKQGR